jgi:hypothetical protein
MRELLVHRERSIARTRPRVRDPARGARRSTEATNASWTPGRGPETESNDCAIIDRESGPSEATRRPPSGPASPGDRSVSVLDAAKPAGVAGCTAA